MSFIDALTVALFIEFREMMWLFIILYALAHAVYVYYFWANGIQFPYASAIPFVRVLHYRSLSGIGIGWIIAYCIFTASAFFIPHILFWALWLIFGFILEYKQAQVCADCNPLLYALCPPFKLYYLYKAGKEAASMEI